MVVIVGLVLLRLVTVYSSLYCLHVRSSYIMLWIFISIVCTVIQ